MKFKKVITGIALATAAALSLAAYTTQNAEAASKSSSKTVKVGVMTFSDTEKARWDKIKELVGDKANIEFTEFTDYTQPNEAVANKEIDINAFQHYNFLENWNKENKQNLVPIADTYLAPIRLYSDKVKKVKSIPKNGTIAIP
ncbi:MetQ/NlpA family ABC transporter substrate-binding protein, partial [Streptococcus suis]